MTSIRSTSQHLQQGLKNQEYGSTEQDIPDRKGENLGMQALG